MFWIFRRKGQKGVLDFSGKGQKRYLPKKKKVKKDSVHPAPNVDATWQMAKVNACERNSPPSARVFPSCHVARLTSGSFLYYFNNLTPCAPMCPIPQLSFNLLSHPHKPDSLPWIAFLLVLSSFISMMHGWHDLYDAGYNFFNK